MSSEHRSIGDVLDLLKNEFPDITVSKIRFLESQGLIAPERTPSGYRKFYDNDVERLRWILTQQRDHYLPLKVIRSRLDQLEEGEAVDVAHGTPATVVDTVAGPDDQGVADVLDETPPAAAGEPAGETAEERADDGIDETAATGVESGAALSREELAHATGLDERFLKELESYGLLPPPRVTGEEELYDEQAVVVARLARGFLRHGVEVRHLRMYKTFAEREAGFVSQLVTPVLRQKNPEARQQARDTVAELARLGGGLRAAMLRLALRDAFGE